ncbi:MAG: hypothetical protein JW984_05080 [Deltaproteobacteria bacterium]|uniref:Uncharacterized protein n=1 Tax=Candidatus Zymogenus saltonus TaxID=2844893 RepID=A0A9D8PMT3_9DELT|nr:hypothetical protein [Candidatus Zymogenus saltonus]
MNEIEDREGKRKTGSGNRKSIDRKAKGFFHGRLQLKQRLRRGRGNRILKIAKMKDAEPGDSVVELYETAVKEMRD